MGNLHNASWAKLTFFSSGDSGRDGVAPAFPMAHECPGSGGRGNQGRGFEPRASKALVLIPATLAASASVAVAGVIGLVGLVVPHMTRMLHWPGQHPSLPASIALGGSFLLLVDDCSAHCGFLRNSHRDFYDPHRRPLLHFSAAKIQSRMGNMTSLLEGSQLTSAMVAGGYLMTSAIEIHRVSSPSFWEGTEAANQRC